MSSHLDQKTLITRGSDYIAKITFFVLDHGHLAWVANQNTEFALSSLATESPLIYILHVIKSVLPKSEIKKIYIRGVLQISSDGDD